ncbi:MAG: precorrin-6A reductase [Firmicutes bacterium]|nr:precorrin-6A reductase [Bacillota bacterium]
MRDVFLFAGTSEGREMAEYLSSCEIEFDIFTATEYGGEAVSNIDNAKIFSGRLDSSEIEREILCKNPRMVIDATHPFAVEVSKNIKEACVKNNVNYMRLLREFENEKYDNAVYVNDFQGAVEYLDGTRGKIFVSTGSRDISSLTALNGFEQRVAVRLLPLAENLMRVVELGVSAQNIVCAQGPFSIEMNEAVMKHFSAKYMLTKESGIRGGFREKMEACKNIGVTPVVIRRPKEEGLSFSEVKRIVDAKFDVVKKRISVIGMGCGSIEGMTLAAKRAIDESGLVVGSARALESILPLGKDAAVCLNSDDILKLVQHSSAERIAVLFSGDIGLFSGATKLRNLLKDYHVEYISGISSFVYFMNKIGKSYENTKMMSLHGRNDDFVKAVNENESVFMLLGGNNTVESVCRKLVSHGLGDVDIYVGENLSYKNENITTTNAHNAAETEFEPLSVMLAENRNFHKNGLCISDESFLRGNVPMTKSEVRAISVSKLRLNERSVLYDIGSGTGSVSVEAAGLCKKVYSVEKKRDAAELTKKNLLKFSVGNAEVICGEAPECLEGLETPTHVFIGGTGGSMDRIVDILLKKNRFARFVINAITLETLGSALSAIEKYDVCDEEIVQIYVSKSKNVGKSHMMTSSNPVYIISFTGGSRHE